MSTYKTNILVVIFGISNNKLPKTGFLFAIDLTTVPMNALGFYISTCRYVMQADASDRDTWADLYRYLPYLRQSLSCYVCGNILHVPIGPTHSICPHHICQKCRGGKMRLKPSCSWCKDQQSFVENKQLRILIMCFKKLCEYIYHSPIGHDLRAIASNGETNNLGTIIQEGLSVLDDFQLSQNSTVIPHVSTTLPSKPRGEILTTPPTHKTTDQDNRERRKSDNHNSFSKTSAESGNKHHQSKCETPSKNEVVNPIHENRNPTVADRPMKNAKFNTCGRNRTRTVFGRNRNKLRHLRNPKQSNKLYQRNKVGLTDVNKNEHPVNIVKDTPGSPNTPSNRPGQTSGERSVPDPQTDNSKSRICKCGRAGTNSRLTCLGQRCPCYSLKLPCIGCKCRGCRNPKKPPNCSSSEKREFLVNGDKTITETACISIDFDI